MKTYHQYHCWWTAYSHSKLRIQSSFLSLFLLSLLVLVTKPFFVIVEQWCRSWQPEENCVFLLSGLTCGFLLKLTSVRASTLLANTPSTMISTKKLLQWNHYQLVYIAMYVYQLIIHKNFQLCHYQVWLTTNYPWKYMYRNIWNNHGIWMYLIFTVIYWVPWVGHINLFHAQGSLWRWSCETCWCKQLWLQSLVSTAWLRLITNTCLRAASIGKWASFVVIIPSYGWLKIRDPRPVPGWNHPSNPASE